MSNQIFTLEFELNQRSVVNVQYVMKQLVSVKFVILLQLSKISVKTFKESPYFEGTTWLVLMTHFLNVQYVMKQLVGVKFVILFQLSKISVKTSKESPYFKGTTWLVLMTHFLNVQYVMKQLVIVNFVILFQLSKISVITSKESPYFKGTTWLVLMTYFLNVQYVMKYRGSPLSTNSLSTIPEVVRFINRTKVCFKETVTHLLLYTIANV